MTSQPNPAGRFMISGQEFQKLRKLIHEATGISLSDHKKELVVSRLAKRLRALELDSFSQYYEFLTTSNRGPDELIQMINRITTNKTDFYREDHHFKYLAEYVLPELVALKGERGDKKIRAWSAACSTGEEPYTLAITLKEFFAQHPGWDVKLLATDLDTEVLTFASRGLYPEDRVKPVPRAYLAKYFTRTRGPAGPAYQVANELRQMITFRKMNLHRKTFPFKVQLDFIFCRNVMIYFDMEDKITLLTKFHHHLRTGSHIFVGHSESLMMVKDLFKYVQSTVYKKI